MNSSMRPKESNFTPSIKSRLGESRLLTKEAVYFEVLDGCLCFSHC
jgi:hypothetical protein